MLFNQKQLITNIKKKEEEAVSSRVDWPRAHN